MLHVYCLSFERCLHRTYAIHNFRIFHTESTGCGEGLGTDIRLRHSMRSCSHWGCVHTYSRSGSWVENTGNMNNRI